MPGASLLTDAERAFRSGDAGRAERLLKRILSSDPSSTRANELLAYVLGNRGDLEGARRRLEIATSRPGASAESWYYLGNCLLKQGAHAEAIVALENAARARGDFFEALHDLGLAKFQQGEALAALEWYERAIAINPGSFEARYNRGRALDGLSRHEEALASYEAALAINPGHVPSLNNRGAALHDLGRLDEALASFERALAVSSAHVEAWSGRGVVLHAMARWEDALASFARASALSAGGADSRWRESLTRLMVGDFSPGWRGYEARWQCQGADIRRHAHLASWDGTQPLAGKRILAWAEQGYGDTIQFCRYVALLRSAGAEVVLEVQPPLRALLAELAGATVVGRGEAIPACDWQIPLMSLPLAFGTARDTIPAEVPYLQVDAGRVERARARLGERIDGRTRVGIACSGNPRNSLDARRSMPLERFASLAEFADLFVIEKDLRANDARWLREAGKALRPVGDAIEDFTDTAAVVACMDVVISVDTALAHLAGALAKPTWILLQRSADWRWQAEGARSPWYPTATLFRQSIAGDWDGVMEAVRGALRAWPACR